MEFGAGILQSRYRRHAGGNVDVLPHRQIFGGFQHAFGRPGDVFTAADGQKAAGDLVDRPRGLRALGGRLAGGLHAQSDGAGGDGGDQEQHHPHQIGAAQNGQGILGLREEVSEC